MSVEVWSFDDVLVEALQVSVEVWSFDVVLAEIVVFCNLQHVLPTVSLPPHKDEVTYPLPGVVYRMFDYTDVAEVRFLS